MVSAVHQTILEVGLDTSIDCTGLCTTEGLPSVAAGAFITAAGPARNAGDPGFLENFGRSN